MPPGAPQGIYSATYSNVPVYEFNCDGNHVMRRRKDDWINATHILKVADYDKPARTRILEREVQKGVHEKVQGGYGKYQGTWVPLEDGRGLADRVHVLQKLLPMFDFVPGDRSPPPAPKHATAVSSRPKAPRASAISRRPAASQISEDHFEDASAQYNETPDNASVVTDSVVDEQEHLHHSQFSTSSRKRKRGMDQISAQDQQHQLWADQLLDYFMLLHSDDRFPAPPEPHPTINLDRPIDDKGHSAMHWAAAMGDVDVVGDLIRRGARIDSLSNNLETPLMRAVLFTNNFDKNTMPQMVHILQSTVQRIDWFGSTVFHHIAATTSSKNKYPSARYYVECIVSKLADSWSGDDITRLLNMRDKNGDTAVMIAARNGARKCVRSLLGRGVGVDIPNNVGETADDLIRLLNQRRRDGRRRDASSSPFGPDGLGRLNGTAHGGIPLYSAGGAVLDPTAARNNGGGPSPPQPGYHSQTATTLMHKVAPSLLEKCNALAVAYETELADKDAELAEADRVLRKRQAEIDAVRAQLAELAHQTGDAAVAAAAAAALAGSTAVAAAVVGEDGALPSEVVVQPHPDAEAAEEEMARADRDEEARLDALRNEVEALLEMDQTRELAALVARHEQDAGRIEDGNVDDDNDMVVRLAHELLEAQHTRHALVREMVQHLALAGFGGGSGERQRDYKRLITAALGLRSEEDVEGLLPEILAELEEERRGRLLEA